MAGQRVTGDGFGRCLAPLRRRLRRLRTSERHDGKKGDDGKDDRPETDAHIPIL